MSLRIAIVFSCLLISQLLFSQSPYEKALQNFDIADSLFKNTKEIDQAFNFLEKARTSFLAMDSMKMVFQCDFLETKVLFTTTRDYEACIRQSLEASNLITDGSHDTLKSHHHYYRGFSYYYLFQYDRAGEEFSKVFTAAKTPLKEPQLNINARWMSAVIHAENHEDDEELAAYEQVLQLLEELPESKYKINTKIQILGNLSKVYGRIGITEKCFSYLQEALSLNRSNEDYYSTATEAQLLNFFGYNYIRMGFLDKAREYTLRSLELDDKVDTWNNLAITYKQQERYEDALPIYQKLLAREDLNRQYQAIIGNNIASAYIELGEYEKALKYAREAEAMNRTMERQVGLTISLELLGLIYYETGEHQKAEAYYEEARALIEDKNPEIWMMSSQNFWSMNDTTNAIEYGEQALFETDSTFNGVFASASQFTGVLENQKWLIELYDQLDPESSYEYRDRIVTLSEIAHDHLTAFKDAHHGPTLEIADRSIFLYEEGIRSSLIMEDQVKTGTYLSKAFRFSEWSKVQALEGEVRLKNEQAAFNLPPALIRMETQLKARENFIKSQLENLSNDSSKLDYYTSKLFENRNSQDSLLNIFRTEFPRYNQLRYENIEFSITDIQEKLYSHQAFLEYFQGDTTSYVFTITKNDFQVQPIELDTDTLISHFRDYFKPETFSNDLISFNEVSHHIFQLYVAPALAHLDPSVTELIVVPDGKLSYLPFDILLTENSAASQDWSYLIQNYRIHYTYSASLYFNEFSSLSTNNEYLAFAPEYPENLKDSLFSLRLGTFRNQITPLKYNTAEVDFIGTQFQGLGFFGKNANEENFKEHVGQYGVLHLAMHTVLDDEDPMNSKLVFTHSEDTLEDDMLHAFEIYNMQIPSQLTVLSACETGFGKLAKGEGALSLARAFSYAGSPSVVMSHWPVDDQTTAQLMQHFYGYLAAGKSKSEALRDAKLAFLKTAHPAQQHPFFWGSFVVMGDDAPVTLKKKVEPIYYVLLGLLLLTLIVFWVVRRKKPQPV